MVDHAVAKGMVQQVVVILEGLYKSEPVATGWAKDFDNAKVKIISHLVHGLNDYLNADKSETDSETELEVSDATAAGMGDSLQGGTPQGEEGVPEKEIEDLFVIEEEEIETLLGKDKAPSEVTEQMGNIGDGKGADSEESPEATTRRLKRRG
jgi:hypothetical protein